jgi:hypothetical protein
MRSTIVFAVVCAAVAVLVFPLSTAAQSEETALIARDSGTPTAPKASPAGRCLIGPGLGSTLLFPYVEVDLGDLNGVDTLISVNNGLGNAALTRFVLWTDWGVPTLAFDIFLEGFDVQTISVRQLFAGTIPSSGEGVDLSGFEFCGTLPPHHSNPALTQDEINHLRAIHTGRIGYLDHFCHGADHGDLVARGFITVDVVDECSGLEGHHPIFTPAEIGWPYFSDGGSSVGIAIVDNRLWGDIVYVDYNNNFAQGSEAVSIWADPSEFTGGQIYTFFGRHSHEDGRDERAPLPKTLDQRFLNGGPFSGGADLIVFALPNDHHAEPVDCGLTPAWWPIETTVSSLDEEASNFVLYPDDIFSNMTQRVPISALAPPYPFGLIRISGETQQIWVQTSLSGFGRFSAGYNGIPVRFLCDQTPP